MKLTQLSRASGELEQWSTLNVRFPPELWSATGPYRERREGAGLCRLGLRVVLALIGELDIESAADHLAVSCEDDASLRQVIALSKQLTRSLRYIQAKMKIEDE